VNTLLPSILSAKIRIKDSFLNQFQFIWKLLGFEAIIWTAGLLYLIFLHTPGEKEFTICPFYNLGIDFCPGCGLGDSISYLINGEFISSFQTHPLGIFALLIITFRVITIIKNNWRKYA